MKYQINLLKCIQNAFLHPNHGFCQKKKSVHLAIPPFAAGYSHSGAEFITAQEPERSSPLTAQTPERSSPLHKKYHIDPLKFIQNTLLHPKHGFCQKEICVHPAISPFAGRLLALRSGVHHCTRAGEEFTTAQEVPDTSTQIHSKSIPTYLTMVFVTKEYVFVRLYCPSRQASCTLERSSSLHQNRSGVHCTKGTR